MRTLEEYAAWLLEQTNPDILRGEALERMRVNVGLLAENEELKRRVRMLEEGREPERPETRRGDWREHM